jgi:organic radical activating enzyme
MKTYTVKAIFPTLQGEGFHVGRACVFVRLSGCNRWSGRESDRARDAARLGSRCALFCDTDFTGGDRLTATQIATACAAAGAGKDVFIVLTGGEPLLQVDAELVAALRGTGARVHVETNGTVTPQASFDWVAMSPKVRSDELAVRVCSELKVIVPSYDPLNYQDAVDASIRYIQVEDGPEFARNAATAVAFVMSNPKWRVSPQMHKQLAIP